MGKEKQVWTTIGLSVFLLILILSAYFFGRKYGIPMLIDVFEKILEYKERLREMLVLT